jgi:hypothetical protein
LDVVPNRVKRIEVQVKNFNLDKAKSTSQLKADVAFEEQSWAQLFASSDNCLELWKVLKKYYIKKI